MRLKNISVYAKLSINIKDDLIRNPWTWHYLTINWERKNKLLKATNKLKIWDKNCTKSQQT